MFCFFKTIYGLVSQYHCIKDMLPSRTCRFSIGDVSGAKRICSASTAECENSLQVNKQKTFLNGVKNNHIKTKYTIPIHL